MKKPAVNKFRVAIYGILIESGQVLMTETKVPSGTVFNFPGGGLELGESPADAVLREFREETSIEVRLGALLFCSKNFHQNPDYPSEQLIHVFYQVTAVRGVISPDGNNDDVVGVRWIDRTNLAGLRVMPVDQEFVESEIFLSLMRG